jgi:16S rRNA processing protein RimM
MSQPNQSESIVIGKIGAPYGIKGWSKIITFTEIPEGVFEFSPWSLTLNGKTHVVTVDDWRRHNKGLIAKLSSVDSREQVEMLVHAEISVSADLLPELPEDEHYWRDLKGMQVVNDKGYNFGSVSALMETGSNDVLVVKANHNDAFGQSERLIPFIEDDVVLNVNKQERTITVDWDPGF